MKENKNSTLYFFEGLACIFVVLIHSSLSGHARYIVALGRFAVPLFFTVSGYFFYQKNSINNSYRIASKKKIKHFLTISIVLWIVHMLYSQIEWAYLGNDIGDWFISKFTRANILNLILFNHGELLSINGSYTPDHLWFVFAMVYVYVFLYFVANYIEKIAMPMMGMLLAGLYFVQYSMHDCCFVIGGGYEIGITVFVINWLFDGLTFVLMGVCIAKYKYLFMKKNYSLVLLPVGILLTVFEKRMIGEIDVYFGTLLILLSIWNISLKYNMKDGLFSWIGKNLSIWVYYVHIIVKAIIIDYVPVQFGIEILNHKLFFSMEIIIGSIILSLIIHFISEAVGLPHNT